MVGACVSAFFNTESLANGVQLAEAIGKLAEVTRHRPAIDLRTTGVTVQLKADPAHGLSEAHIDLARQISAAANELGVTSHRHRGRPVYDRRPRHPQKCGGFGRPCSATRRWEKKT